MEQVMLLVLMFIICSNAFLPPILKRFGFRRKSDCLYCGLTGYCGGVPADPNVIRMIMFYNQERGEDSAGWAVNNKVTKEADKVAKFLTKHQLTVTPDDETYTIIGHARKASVGAKFSKELAHPFGVRNDLADLNGPLDLILAMNGTLTNTTQMAEKFGETYVYNTNSDTQILSKIMSKLGPDNFKEALELYDGTATLLFSYPIYKNVLFVYKDKERPLFCWNKSENELYISSMSEPLVAIGAPENDVKSFKDNTFYAINQGKIEIETPITRTPLRPVYAHSKGGHHRNAYYESDYGNCAYSANYHEGACNVGNHYPAQRVTNKSEFANLRERYDSKDLHKNRSSRAYVINERYFRNGHALEGGWYITSSGKFKNAKEAAEDAADCKMYYFINGHMCVGKTAYDKIFDRFKNKDGSFNLPEFKAQKLSQFIDFFKYPCLVRCDGKEVWLLNEEYEELTNRMGDDITIRPFLSDEEFEVCRTSRWTTGIKKVIAETKNVKKVGSSSVKTEMQDTDEEENKKFFMEKLLKNEIDRPFFYFAEMKRSLWHINVSQAAKEYYFKMVIALCLEKEVLSKKDHEELIKLGSEHAFGGKEFINKMEGNIGLLRKTLKMEEPAAGAASAITTPGPISAKDKVEMIKNIIGDAVSEDDMLNSIRLSNTYCTANKFTDTIYQAEAESFEDLKLDWCPDSTTDADKRSFCEAILVTFNMMGKMDNAEALYAINSDSLVDLENKAKEVYESWYAYINDKGLVEKGEEDVNDTTVEQKDSEYYEEEFQQDINEWIFAGVDIESRMEALEKESKSKELAVLQQKVREAIFHLQRTVFKATKTNVL